jgi:predicted ATP-grasp superfamily ATP-dependent carboligase
MRHVLIAGASTRAAAESAAHAGFDVTAIDAYADLDQHRGVRAIAVGRGTGTTADALTGAAAAIDADEVVYLSPFENHPAALAALTRGRRLLGNSVDIVQRVRDPLEVHRTFAERGFTVPRVIVGGGGTEGDTAGRSRWLLKPVRSGGGHGVAPYVGTGVVPEGWYLQEFIDGWPGSVTFVAAGGRCTVLAVSRQLVGESAFGAGGYRYCGSIIDWTGGSVTEATRTRAHALAEAAVEAFGLVGLNGIDFIVRDDIPVPIEINPRWSSSMELVDRASRTPMMEAHIEACDGSLIDVELGRAVRELASGKAIVFARSAVVMPEPKTWLRGFRIDVFDVHDIPRAGQRIEAGQPICTVFADGAPLDRCRAALVECAAGIYDRLASSSV